MDKLQKEQFIKFTYFLGEVLGPRYEIVFHDITDEGSSIAAIANNHISGRTINSPLTAFASKLIQEKTYQDRDYLCDYKAVTGNAKSLQGSTFFIKDSSAKLVGIFCINHDTSEMKNALRKIVEINKLDNVAEIFGAIDDEANQKSILGVEKLNCSIEEILAESINVDFLQQGFILTTKQKQETIANLYDKGVFNIKGAIPIVATALKMSKPGVYQYLQKLKNNNKDKNFANLSKK